MTTSSESILDNTFEHIISTCLAEGETREGLLKKFNDNKLELVKFLRDRAYKEWIKTNRKPADTSDIKRGIQRVIDKNKADKEKEKELEEKFNKDKNNTVAIAVEEKKPIGLAAMVEKEVSPPPPAIKQKPPAEKKRTWTKSTKKSPPPDNSGQASLF